MKWFNVLLAFALALVHAHTASKESVSKTHCKTDTGCHYPNGKCAIVRRLFHLHPSPFFMWTHRVDLTWRRLHRKAVLFGARVCVRLLNRHLTCRTVPVFPRLARAWSRPQRCPPLFATTPATAECYILCGLPLRHARTHRYHTPLYHQGASGHKECFCLGTMYTGDRCRIAVGGVVKTMLQGGAFVIVIMR